MKEIKLKIIIGLMSVALLGLIIIQIYWIKNAYELESKLFDYKVENALHSVVKNVSQDESAGYVVNSFAVDSNLNFISISIDTANQNNTKTKKEGTWESTYNYEIQDTNRLMRISTSIAKDSSEVVLGFNLNSDGKNVHNILKKRLTSAQIDSLKQHKRFFVNDVVEKIIRAGYTKKIEDRINKDDLYKLMKIGLNNNGINTDFILGINLSGKDSILYAINIEQQQLLSSSFYKVQIFPEEQFNPPNYLVLSISGRSDLILKSMTSVLAISLLFISLIIVLYFKTVRMLIRQKKLTEIKNDLINNITHEFKTPISTISLAAEALKEPGLVEDKGSVNKYSTMIEEESNRLQKMVDSLLNTALIKNGSYNLEKRDIDIHSVIKTVIEKNKLRIDKSDFEIRLNLLATNPIIFADKLHISNVINNIIDNAINYSHGKPVIKITTDRNDQGIMINISDNGIGIHKSHHKKIFETFYRVPTGNIQNVRGYGIGLSYVKKIVESHKGSVKVESKPERGTTFKIFLPGG